MLCPKCESKNITVDYETGVTKCLVCEYVDYTQAFQTTLSPEEWEEYWFGEGEEDDSGVD